MKNYQIKINQNTLNLPELEKILDEVMIAQDRVIYLPENPLVICVENQEKVTEIKEIIGGFKNCSCEVSELERPDYQPEMEEEE